VLRQGGPGAISCAASLILLDTPRRSGNLFHSICPKQMSLTIPGVRVSRLRESSQIDVIIPLLEAALSDPRSSA